MSVERKGEIPLLLLIEDAAKVRAAMKKKPASPGPRSPEDELTSECHERVLQGKEKALLYSFIQLLC